MSSASAAILLLRSSSLRSRSVLVRTTTASILSQQQPQPQYAAFSTTTNANSNNNNSKPASLRRDDLVKTVAETHELSQAESRRIIDTIVDTISDVSIMYSPNYSCLWFGSRLSFHNVVVPYISHYISSTGCCIHIGPE